MSSWPPFVLLPPTFFVSFAAGAAAWQVIYKIIIIVIIPSAPCLAQGGHVWWANN